MHKYNFVGAQRAQSIYTRDIQLNSIQSLFRFQQKVYKI